MMLTWLTREADFTGDADPAYFGLTVVRLLDREGACLRAAGLDMLDGTPVLDIKPYLSSIPGDQLRRGWLAEAEQRAGQVSKA